MHMFTVFGLFSKQYREVFRIYCMDETDIRLLTSPEGILHGGYQYNILINYLYQVILERWIFFVYA
jgi:hypothetical protein